MLPRKLSTILLLAFSLFELLQSPRYRSICVQKALVVDATDYPTHLARIFYRPYTTNI